MTDDEREQARRLQRSDPDSFRELYAVYGARVYRFCRHLCGNPDDADDLTQEVFLAAFQGRERFEGRSSIATWLYRIAIYRRRAVRARGPQTVPLEELDLPPIPDPTPARVERLSLEDALSELSEPLRETFLLVRVEGLKLREAAEALGVPLGTVKSRLHDATMRLQAILSHEDGEGSPPPCRCGKGGENEV